MSATIEEWTCNHCKGINSVDKENCWNCLRSRNSTSNPAVSINAITSESKPPHVSIADSAAQRYPAIGKVRSILNFFAVFDAVVLGIVALVSLTSFPGATGVVAAIPFALAAVLQWIFLRAASEALGVLVDIEANTRAAAKVSKALTKQGLDLA